MKRLLCAHLCMRHLTTSSLPFQLADLLCSVTSDSFVTLWTVVPQAPSVHGGFQARIVSGLPFPPLGDLPNPGIKPSSPPSLALQADSLLLSHLSKLT